MTRRSCFAYSQTMGYGALVIHRLQSDVVSWWLRRNGTNIGDGVRFIGRPLITLAKGSTIEIGERSRLVSVSSRTPLGVNHRVVMRTLTPDAVLVLGSDVGVSGGTICAAQHVEIGDGTMLGANVTIMDTDFHPLQSGPRRYAPMPAPRIEDAVIVGRNVFIGASAIILKGTIIGDDAVIGAGAVVRGRFPAGAVVIGNPAKARESRSDIA